MFTVKISGTIKQDETKEYTNKAGQQAKQRNIFIEPDNSIYPIQVSIPESYKVGKVGEKIVIDVESYPFYLKDGKRERANISYFIREKKVN